MGMYSTAGVGRRTVVLVQRHAANHPLDWPRWLETTLEETGWLPYYSAISVLYGSLTTLTNLTTLFYEDIVVRHEYARMDVARVDGGGGRGRNGKSVARDNNI
jgi:hypothetical protein